jgi:hypothetical protein
MPSLHGTRWALLALPWVLLGSGGGRIPAEPSLAVHGIEGSLAALEGDSAKSVRSPSNPLRAPEEAQNGIAVIGSLVRTFQVAHGSEVTGRILVRNGGFEPQVVRAYLTDYVPLREDGSSGFPEPGTHPRSNAGWIDLLPAEQVVLPGETASVAVMIRVPEDGPGAGTYWSVVMVEGVPPATLEPPPPTGEVRVAIREVFRTAVRIVTEVEGTTLRSEASLRFTDRALRMGEAGPELHLGLENDGARSLRLDLWVELFDEAGASLGRFTTSGLSLLPGETGARRISLDGVPPGVYEALVVADNRDEAVFGARYRLEIPGATTQLPR